MATICDKDAVREAYNTVRDDKTDTNWAVFKYEGNMITLGSTGTDYESFLANLDPSQRIFAFLRIFTGDEMSRRAKFAFISWIGSDVNPLKRAKVSIEKGLVKEIITNFAVELATSDVNDLAEERVREAIVKAGGANYGTGVGKN